MDLPDLMMPSMENKMILSYTTRRFLCSDFCVWFILYQNLTVDLYKMHRNDKPCRLSLVGCKLVLHCRLVVAMGYYGLSLYSANLNGDLFVNFLLSGLVEFPAYTLCFFCIKFGRKGPYICSMLVGGLACIAVVLAHNFLDGTYVLTSLYSLLCFSSSWAVCLLPNGPKNS